MEKHSLNVFITWLTILFCGIRGIRKREGRSQRILVGREERIDEKRGESWVEKSDK